MKVEKTTLKWSKSLCVGLTTNKPDEMPFPPNICGLTAGQTWLFSGTSIMHSNEGPCETVSEVNTDLNDVKVVHQCFIILIYQFEMSQARCQEIRMQMIALDQLMCIISNVALSEIIIVDKGPRH